MPADNTARKEAEAAQKESEDRFRFLFEAIPDGALLLDSAGRILMANREAERILGFSREEMQGKTSAELRWKLVREDGSDFPFEEHPAFIALRTAQPVRGVVIGVFQPGHNHCRWIRINALPWFRSGMADALSGLHDVCRYQIFPVPSGHLHKAGRPFMTRKRTPLADLTVLRRQAEAQLNATKKKHLDFSPSPDEMQRIIHELAVYQIELEMQQDELLQTRMELEESLDCYTELYDFAPLGYLTIDQRGGDTQGKSERLKAAWCRSIPLDGRSFRTVYCC